MPKFILSKSKVMEQFKLVDDLADIVSYSSKTNPKITPILEEETNCMFSIHLQTELKNIKDFSRVLYLAQGWNDKEIITLLKKGVKWFVVDNEVDLEILFDIVRKDDFLEKFGKINLLLRLKLKENTMRTEKYYVFGMYSELIVKKISEIKNSDLSVKFVNVGIHFHRKSQNVAEWKLQFELENTFENNFFKIIDIINIGGGLPSVYANTNVRIFDGIYQKIKETKVWFNKNDIKMMIEPGRFIAAPAGKLMTKIIGIHENTIIVDASVYNGDLDALVVPVKLLVENELSSEEEGAIKYVVKGVTPCSMDLFRYRVYLSKKKAGDDLIFINAGAYNFLSDFCDMEPVITEIVD